MALPDDNKQIGQTDVRRAARLSVAPMMDWTDRHCRYFHRLLSQKTLLYTEMVTAPALVKGGALHLLDYAPEEHPVALQLGGSDPQELAQATRQSRDWGYDEVNLNVGCPSDRVQSGRFGAVLMEEPALVTECVSTMVAASTGAEVTVKCRIGVDDQNAEDVLPEFLARVATGGVRSFTVHARKAWLQGLSPKENRDVPPLDYDLVYRMKALFPALEIVINGGITNLAEVETHLEHVDGVMLGRAAYHEPALLGHVDKLLFDSDAETRAEDAVLAMLPYIERELGKGTRLNQITRHMLGIFTGRPGARRWRRMLSEEAHKDGAGPDLVERALNEVSRLAA